MNLKLNAFSWNPMEPYVFTAASEDFNLHTFDCRFFKHPKRVYIGHTNAVMDVNYSPSGREFASASYDDTVSYYYVLFLFRLVGLTKFVDNTGNLLFVLVAVGS